MVYKDSAGKEIHEGDSLMDLTPGFVGEISEVFLDEDEGELAVNQDGTTIYLYEIDTEVSSLIVNEETMNIEKEEDDDEVVLSPDEALDLHECIQELEEADIRYNVNGQSIENGAIRLSYNIYQQNILVSKVWLNKIESKELVNLIQRHFDNQ